MFRYLYFIAFEVGELLNSISFLLTGAGRMVSSLLFSHQRKLFLLCSNALIYEIMNKQCNQYIKAL